jgi:Protein of unknown function (DUF4058)
MKSPFPGMDPFIEASGRWEDFHKKFIGDMERRLSLSLPERYHVSLAERSYVVLAGAEGKDRSSFQPDLGVTSSVSEPELPAARAETALADPLTERDSVPVRAFIATEYRELFIEIYAALEEDYLVTAIEVLSPSNKRYGTPGWDLYQRKRQGLLLGQANFVEIDLLREAGRLPMFDPWPKSPYAILVVRRERAPAGRAWPAHFDRALPEVPVPLLAPDPDVKLPLQLLVDDIYQRSRYAQVLDYARRLKPPLKKAEKSWLEQHMQTRDHSASEPAPRRPRKRGRAN